MVKPVEYLETEVSDLFLAVVFLEDDAFGSVSGRGMVAAKQAEVWNEADELCVVCIF